MTAVVAVLGALGILIWILRSWSHAVAAADRAQTRLAETRAAEARHAAALHRLAERTQSRAARAGTRVDPSDPWHGVRDTTDPL